MARTPPKPPAARRGLPGRLVSGFHGWRGFVADVAIVVIGVLLALGAEQVVTGLHNRSQVAEMSAKLRAESLDNQNVVAYDIAQLANLRSVVERDIAALGGCRNPAAVAALEPLPQNPIFLPGTGAWRAIGDSALMPLMPPLLAENHVKLEAMVNGGYASRMLDLRRSLDRAAGAVEIVGSGGADRQVCDETLLALGELKHTVINLIQLANMFREANGRALANERIDVDIGLVPAR